MEQAFFHPLVHAWFAETYGRPTPVQAGAWPLIGEGKHVLALAPTGSGKTLTAFLAALSRFAGGTYPAEGLSVLYVSPLKALNEDIKRNLLDPLEGIRSRFEAAGLSFPGIRIETRSGDTPQGDRRRFLARPPAILALTPESLAILLLNPKGRQILSGVKYLILDEIHSVLGNKRGCFLSCQIDRLSLIAGEFQRVALSATVRPPEAAAEFAGSGRALHVVNPPMEKEISFSVDFPGFPPETPAENAEDPEGLSPRYRIIIGRILESIQTNRTTLVFVDSRRRAERLARLINLKAGRMAAYTHHGSLSRDLRRAVERRLAEGSLPCVVATASLELGIDIGSVDEVILAGSPGSVSRTLQRIGRSGHGVGRVSRGSLLPFHGMDLLLGAALAEAVNSRDIEESRPIENPLDLLAQLILALCIEKNRNINELYDLIRGFYIYRNLGRPPYDRVVLMLAGLGRGKVRLRELKPRLYLDAETGELSAAKGTLQLLYSSGGVITNRGLYSMRLSDGTKIGELDEEFVYERRIGDTFEFGSRGWRILSIGAEAVEVEALDKNAGFTASEGLNTLPKQHTPLLAGLLIPFWRADSAFRSPVLVRHVLEILDRCGRGGFNCPPNFSEAAAAALQDFLDSQNALCRLPGSSSLSVELIDNPPGGGDFFPAVFHTFRGGAVNYPLALALSQELEDCLGLRVDAYPDDNGILFLLPRPAGSVPGPGTFEELLRRSLAALDESAGELSRGERLFRRRLESSGIFGASFRDAAERSLLIPKQGFGRRTPLWLMRQRSKRLFDAAAGEDGFPAAAEAWRSCLKDTFDMEGFRNLVSGLRDGTIKISFFATRNPSPFSQGVIRQETGVLIYEYDERPDLRGRKGGEDRLNRFDRALSLSDRAIAEALGEAALRPVLAAGTVSDFVSRLRRELPGWAPDDPLGLAEWVKERIALPLDEWELLNTVLPGGLKANLETDPGLGGRICVVLRKGAAVPSVVHREWRKDWEKDPLPFLGPWLRYEGPLPLSRITGVFGVTAARAEDALLALAEAEELVRDVALEGRKDEGFFCDRENLDLLLRLSRKKARPRIREKPAVLLSPFLALRQGLLRRPSAAGGNAADRETAAETGSASAWKSLFCLAGPVKLWETGFLPARIENYNGSMLDRKIKEGRLLWYGAGKERAGICRPEDLELILPEITGLKDFPQGQGDFFHRPRDFWEIREASGLSSRDCAARLWDEAWRGRLSADSFEPVRQGMEFGFIPGDSGDFGGGVFAGTPQAYSPGQIRRRIPRALRDRWKTGAPVRGNWFSLEGESPGGDPLEEEELSRDRIRLLLERWGILCRPLLEREAPPLYWSRLLPAMRRMELSGELVTGRFFSGINSLQFAAPHIVPELEKAEVLKDIYWMNAADPASTAGLDAEGLDPKLPSRSALSRLCFRGSELIALSNRSGREARIFTGPGDPNIPVIVDFFKAPRLRNVLPEKKLCIETINGKPAAGAYAEAFKAAGFIPDRGKLFLW